MLVAVGLMAAAPVSYAAEPGVLLENFADFPTGWKIKNDNPRVAEIYRVITEGNDPYLSATVGPKSGVRVFKYAAWNTRTYPIISWKWRLKAFSPEKRRSVAFYVSLHRDSFGIPTIVKYLWSTHEPVGTVRPGGMFGATEIVIASGSRPDPSAWMTARVDAVADYKRLYGAEPDLEAVGIGLLPGSGIEADIADVRVESPPAVE